MKRILGILPKSFRAFLVIGAIGFVVDAAVLALLVHSYGWGAYTARLASFAAAVSATWYLNRRFAFNTSKTTSRRREYTRYLSVQGAGLAINFAVYSLCIEISTLMEQWPVLAMAAGSVVALLFNYAGARKLVFTGNGNTDKLL